MTKIAPKKKTDKRKTQGLDTSQLKMTTTEVSKDDLFTDFAVVRYNVNQLKKQITDKRLVKIYEKLMTNPLTADEEYPLKGDLEKLLFLNLQEMRAITVMMAEILYNEHAQTKTV